mmetsp:Transcript_100020/g.288808  ORF Transcript_100020/g.288808 Transcript_100020/m.288808 type:complete len:301 (+) Transcript_100020:931-1833(+)
MAPPILQRVPVRAEGGQHQVQAHRDILVRLDARHLEKRDSGCDGARRDAVFGQLRRDCCGRPRRAAEPGVDDRGDRVHLAELRGVVVFLPRRVRLAADDNAQLGGLLPRHRHRSRRSAGVRGAVQSRGQRGAHAGSHSVCARLQRGCACDARHHGDHCRVVLLVELVLASPAAVLRLLHGHRRLPELRQHHGALLLLLLGGQLDRRADVPSSPRWRGKASVFLRPPLRLELQAKTLRVVVAIVFVESPLAARHRQSRGRLRGLLARDNRPGPGVRDAEAIPRRSQLVPLADIAQWPLYRI